jgi:hypothetical protein
MGTAKGDNLRFEIWHHDSPIKRASSLTIIWSS